MKEKTYGIHQRRALRVKAQHHRTGKLNVISSSVNAFFLWPHFPSLPPSLLSPSSHRASIRNACPSGPRRAGVRRFCLKSASSRLFGSPPRSGVGGAAVISLLRTSRELLAGGGRCEMGLLDVAAAAVEDNAAIQLLPTPPPSLYPGLTCTVAEASERGGHFVCQFV